MKVITRAEVKKHNYSRNVWIIIHNEVYDVTKFLNEHPGGVESLMEFAGKDGTQGFEDVGHSDDARALMKKYKVGKLPPSESTVVEESCALSSKPRQNECTVCQAASCPGLPKATGSEKSWRTFDGSPDRAKTPKSEHKAPPTAKAQRRVQSIVVPRESSVPALPTVSETEGAMVPQDPEQTQTTSSGKCMKCPYSAAKRRRRRRPSSLPPPPPCGRLKWVLLALGVAILIGVAVKKYSA